MKRFKQCLNDIGEFTRQKDLQASNSWIWIFFSVSIIFWGIPSLDLEIFPLLLGKDVLLTQIDNRTSDIISLISIIFVIVGFIIASLASKDDYIYRIIFRATLLFQTLYLGISLIIYFIVFSSIKDLYTHNQVATALLCGLILILVLIFLMGRMFKYLIIFLRPQNIQKHVLREFDRELDKFANEDIMIWSPEYFELKHDIFSQFYSIRFLRENLFKSVTSKDSEQIRNYLHIILSSYQYQSKINSKRGSLKLFEPQKVIYVLNMNIFPEYIQDAIRESILKNSLTNLEVIRSFIIKLEGQSIYEKKGEEISAEHFKLALNLLIHHYTEIEQICSLYNIEIDVIKQCEEAIVDDVIGAYSHISRCASSISTSHTRELKHKYYEAVERSFYEIIRNNNILIFQDGTQELIEQLFSVGYSSTFQMEQKLLSFTKIEENELHQYEEIFLIRNILFRLRYWIHFLRYSTNQPKEIDKSLLPRYRDSLDIIFKEANQKLEEFIWMYLSNNKRRNWDYRKIKSGRVFTPIDEKDWLVNGYINSLITNNIYPSLDLRMHKSLILYFRTKYNKLIVEDLVMTIQSSLYFAEMTNKESKYDFDRCKLALETILIKLKK